MPWDNTCGNVDRRQGRNTEQRCRELYRDCGRQGYKQVDAAVAAIYKGIWE